VSFIFVVKKRKDLKKTSRGLIKEWWASKRAGKCGQIVQGRLREINEAGRPPDRNELIMGIQGGNEMGVAISREK